jgi:hypothetical protein
MWCEYTCTENQHLYVTNNGLTNVTDPGDPTRTLLVLNQTLTLSP